MNPSISADSALASVQNITSEAIAQSQQNALAQGGISATQDASQIKITSMDQFQRDYPQLANAMLMAFAQQVVQQMQDAEKRREQIQKDANAQNGG